ncbi:MAG: ABC transporter ATP-binding protein [Bacteroidetes bacterium]|jgi:ABC-2 type transport system ATP-binding protein|nr:ABC transporter ATP-binding protein [Bacteroidota bacterium]MBT7142509.1 ABC transporter ATP-binding protein [Bacteroidota bacterium]MBT7490725.1 ABC transporter ATP-binding protein [Bacteroidota bacterium]
MINVTNLSKIYGDTKVLDISELTINKNESFGLVGNNGAGKTTFFRLILDLIRANSGKVESNNVDVKKTNNWKYYTGSYLDQSFLIDFLTPEEYFEFISSVHGLSKGDITEFYNEFDEFFAGEILGKQKYIRDLSQGNRQKVGIAAALMQDPELLVLDEPFNGLDPSTQIRLINLLNEKRKTKNMTMLISSHDLNHVTEVCSRIAILEKGKIVNDLEKNENTLIELEKYFSV